MKKIDVSKIHTPQEEEPPIVSKKVSSSKPKQAVSIKEPDSVDYDKIT